MALPRGQTIPASYQRILKQFSSEKYKHGQEGLANQLGAGRERISRVLNGKPVTSDLADEIVNFAEEVIREDPDVIERAYTERKREPLLPQMKLAELIEKETRIPPALASMVAHAAWKRILVVASYHTNALTRDDQAFRLPRNWNR